MIKFYRVGDEYGEFSNFARYPITVDGREWPTSEHYYQAQKYAGTKHEEKVRLVDSPGKAWRLGNDPALPLRADWEEVKDDVMRKAVHAKFSQHDSLRELLLSTGNAKIVEHTKNDSYWGDGGDGSGKNTLGKILMSIRLGLKGKT